MCASCLVRFPALPSLPESLRNAAPRLFLILWLALVGLPVFSAMAVEPATFAKP